MTGGIVLAAPPAISDDGEERHSGRIECSAAEYEQLLRGLLPTVSTERFIGWANYMTSHWRTEKHRAVAERVARDYVETRWPSRRRAA